MISASSAFSASNEQLDSLEYINSLITGATENGSYNVFVDGKIFNDTMSDVLTRTYGYRVTKSFNDMGTFPTYKIEWNPLYETISQTAIFFSSDVYGGARWFYATMDFVAGQITSLVDTGLNLNDYNLWDIYPLQNKGYATFFGNGSDIQVFFIDKTGVVVNQYSGSTNYNYDNLEGKWVYWNDYNNDVFRAFNGTDVYSLSYENYQDVYVDWDWDGATNGGTFQYTLYDDNDITDSVRLVKSDTTMVELELFNVNDYYHNSYVYGNIIVVEKYNNGDGQILEYKIYNEQGTLLETIDVSGGNYNNQDINMFGDSNFNVILYNSGDVNVPYRIITYLKESSTLINETHNRSSDYQNWNVYSDALGMYTKNYYTQSLYVYFYDDSYGYETGNFYSLSYCDLYYIEEGNTTSNLEVLQNSGSPDKFISLEQSMSARNMFIPFVDVDGYIKFKLIKSTGNSIRSSNILHSDITDAGWTRIIGDYYGYKIETNNIVMNIFCLKYDNSEYFTYQFDNNEGWDDWTYYNIYIFSNYDDGSWRYFNSNSGGFELMSFSGHTTNIYDGNSYYNSDNVMKDNVVIHYPNDNLCTVITNTTYHDNISLPANNNYYDLEVMKDYFVYLYMDASTDNLTAKAYDLTGNEVNSIDTGIALWSEGSNSAENRYWFSQKTDGSGQMVRYHLFTNNYHETVDISNYSTNNSFNDVVWWD